MEIKKFLSTRKYLIPVIFFVFFVGFSELDKGKNACKDFTEKISFDSKLTWTVGKDVPLRFVPIRTKESDGV